MGRGYGGAREGGWKTMKGRGGLNGTGRGGTRRGGKGREGK